MRKTLLDLDESLLHEAQKVLGTPTKKATVTAALLEVIAQKARKEEIAFWTDASRHDLGSTEIMDKAWQ